MKTLKVYFQNPGAMINQALEYVTDIEQLLKKKREADDRLIGVLDRLIKEGEARIRNYKKN